MSTKIKVKDLSAENDDSYKEDVKFGNISSEVDERAAQYFKLFTEYRDHRNQPIRFLNKNGLQRNITDYVEDSIDRMNENKLKPSYKEDWQNNVFDPITRNKVITVLSILASSRMQAEVQMVPDHILNTKGIESKKRVFGDLLEFANRHNGDAYQLIWEMYTAMSEGTVFGYESWVRDTRKVEYVKEYDPETGERKTETVTADYWDDVYGEIVPLRELYPETIWVNAKDFKHKVKRIFRARTMTKARFIDLFGKFENAKRVGSTNVTVGDFVTDYADEGDVAKLENLVFVLMYYDEVEDKMGIWGNGMEVYWGPLPWNHKKKPFWVSIFEPIHHELLFGKSLPDKMMGMQDVDNGVLNAMLDQLLLALNSPIFVDGEIDDFDDGYLEPGRLYTTTPGAKVQRAALGQVDQTAFNMLDLIKRSMEESSISAQAQGVPTGGRKTKYEVQQLQEGALNLASLFLQLMEHSLAEKYWLRMHNILQYYSMPSRKKSGKKQFKFIEVGERRLSNGRLGKRMVQIVGSSSEMPKKEELRSAARELTGEEFDPTTAEIEPIVVTRDYLLMDGLSLEIQIVPNSSVKESEAMKKNRDITFYNMTAQNPMIDQETNLRDLVRAFGKSSDIIKKANEMQNPLQGQEQGQGQGQGTPGMPGQRGVPAPGANPNVNFDDIL